MRKKKKRKNNGRIVLLIVIIAALIVALFLLFGDSLRGKGNDVSPNISSESDDQTNPDDEEESTVTSDTSTGISSVSSLWYFDPANTSRYESFSAQNPGIALEDVIWMVEANLDMEPYDDAVAAVDVDSNTALVNKYFYLEEDFTPTDLVTVGSSMLRKEAAEAMQKMIKAAEAEGHNLWVQSGYRSFTVQQTLYNKYSANDGVELADTYSARPGHSEHQTGLAVDFNTITDAFGELPEGRWAADNSWRYGYILRYTKQNTEITKYRSEPWHFRYIGEEYAAVYKEYAFQSYEEFWVKNIKFSPSSVVSTEDDEEAQEEESSEE
jgi:D-alanyl-D-alanine carboxypeptidase